MARRFGSAMISNTDPTLFVYSMEHIRVKAYKKTRMISRRAGMYSTNWKPLRLFDWPRTQDEDVHESSGALLPVWTGRYVGDADQRPK